MDGGTTRCSGLAIESVVVESPRSRAADRPRSAMTLTPSLEELLIPTRHLERRKLADFAEYSIDAKSAKAFGRAWAPCATLALGMILCWTAVGISALRYGGQVATDYALLIVLPFFGCCFGCMYFHGLAARKKPRSLISGKTMAVYLQVDSERNRIVLLYVCHDSKTYFLREMAAECH